MQGRVVDSVLYYLLQLGLPMRAMQGAVYVLSCVVGFTVRLGQLGLARLRSGVCVCVVGAPWWDVWRDLGGVTCMFSCVPPTIGC